MNEISFEQAARYGFVFPGARAWITGPAENLASDAALVTRPGASVPPELTSYIDPSVIDILTAPRKAREILGEVKKGDWTVPYAKFRVNELTGTTAPYSDYGQAGQSGVNYEWASRKQYVFQTTVRYGDLESAVTSAAKISLAADKQRSAANALDMDSNRFYLLGVDGMEIYGLLNDPNLPEAVTPLSVENGGSSTVRWENKTAVQIYSDVLALFGELVTRSGGWIEKDTPLILAVSPELSRYLGSATDFNVSVQDMLDRYFKDLKVVTVPQLHNAASGETAMMIAREVMGVPAGELAYGDKMRAGRVVADVSSYKQKFVASTYGAVIYLPFAVAQMTGM